MMMLRDGPMVDAHRVTLESPDDFDGWRSAARALVEAGVPPQAVVWDVAGGERDLFGTDTAAAAAPAGRMAVPRGFVDLARSAVCHSDPQRFALLYALLWKLRRDRSAMEDRADPLLHRIERLAKEVRRDVHKMHAFVRFREVEEADGTSRFVAFFEPDHHIVRHTAGFFVRRFANMRWSILTPEISLHWDCETLSEGPGAQRSDAPDGDPTEDSWKTYFASIFNPARLKVGAMLKEMPKKYWHNMPETALVGPLIAQARQRETAMIDRSVGSAGESDPLAGRAGGAGHNLESAWSALRDQAMGCTRCPLYRPATRTVFGEGPLDAAILFVGEQPGDQEDLAGRPFVGPAGQVFDEALAAAGIDRSATYVTNAVKHFKFVQRGKSRIHSKPDGGEISACRWWLEQELEMIQPRLVVALGASAARSLFGKAMTIAANRGRPHVLPTGQEAWITVHPSYLLRLPDAQARESQRLAFVADLQNVRERAARLAA